MAIGTGTDAAIGAADLTLVNGDPKTVAEALLLARVTLAVIRGDLLWAFGYNVIAIPAAALGYLNPLFAGIAMAASSLLVVSTVCGCADSAGAARPRAPRRHRTRHPTHGAPDERGPGDRAPAGPRGAGPGQPDRAARARAGGPGCGIWPGPPPGR